MTAMILKDDSAWEPTTEQVNKWKTLYPDIEVGLELNAMVGWLDSNPKKRKTKAGIARFCNTWLKKAQDKGGSGFVRKYSTLPTRDMSTLDDLTQDFSDSESYRRMCFEKYGQYFSHEGVRVVRQ